MISGSISGSLMEKKVELELGSRDTLVEWWRVNGWTSVA